MSYVTCVPAYSTCQHTKCMPTSQFYMPTCQCANKRANVPKGMLIFQTFSLQNAKGNLYTLLLYKKFYIILDIIVIHMICVFIIHKNYILHIYISSHVKEKWAEVLFFETLFFIKNENTKRPGFYLLLGTKVLLIFFLLKQLNKMKGRICVNIVIFLSCDMLGLDIWDSYKRLSERLSEIVTVSFRFLQLCFFVL